MRLFTIKCPHGDHSFQIQYYSLGMSGINEFRCESCPNILGASVYADNHPSKDPWPMFLCECGGRFLRSALYRCRHCNGALTANQIKAHMNWWGTPDGVPGVQVVGAKWYVESGRYVEVTDAIK